MTPALNRYHEHLCVYLRATDTRQKLSAQSGINASAGNTPQTPSVERDWFEWLGIDPNAPQRLKRID
ncbi:MAG: hypothetical protein QM645_06945 [Asticcacaulis sp.]